MKRSNSDKVKTAILLLMSVCLVCAFTVTDSIDDEDERLPASFSNLDFSSFRVDDTISPEPPPVIRSDNFEEYSELLDLTGQ